MAIVAGRRLGSYEIMSAIGADGMREAYQAHDPDRRKHLIGSKGSSVEEVIRWRMSCRFFPVLFDHIGRQHVWKR
jgi:hypothetical protein